jgi:hypothetical protein
MPTTIPFTALGTGNGFPYCLIKSDISSFDHWVTLGGYKKTDAGGVTQEQINLSFQTAMNLFWNTYRFNLDVQMTGTDGSSTKTFTQSFFETNIQNVFQNPHKVVNISAVKPFERVCNSNVEGGVFLGSSLGPGEDEAGFFTAQQNSYNINIHRYYNGDRNDENNFIGYGLGTHIIGLELRLVSSADIRGSVQYFLDSITPLGGSSSFLFDEVGYTTVSGIPLVYGAGASAASGSPADPPPVVSFGANGSSASSSIYGISGKALNPSIDFYTYN